MAESPLPEVGPWARDKLSRLGKYLSAYTTIMKQQAWAKGYVYVDAFAGAGQAVVRKRKSGTEPITKALVDLGDFRADVEARELLDGSPRVALGLKNPFTHYVFVEMDPERLKVLHRLRDQFGGGRTIRVYEADCNTYLRQKLVQNRSVDWKKWRAVVFLDPFGMQVPWETIVGMAETKAIEVIINFPVGMAIQRLLKRTGAFTAKQRAKLDSYFGDPGWYDVVYEQQPGLFGPMAEKLNESGGRLANWYRQRLRAAFGHASEPYLVTNTRGGHLYYLLWAGPNEKAAKIAAHVLSGGTRL